MRTEKCFTLAPDVLREVMRGAGGNDNGTAKAPLLRVSAFLLAYLLSYLLTALLSYLLTALRTNLLTALRTKQLTARRTVLNYPL